MDESNNNPGVADNALGDDGQFKEQDRLLPIANVGRIMKQNLPPNAKISKEAKETMQECMSEFISFVTSEASDKCRKERRKTVNGDDICWAMQALGFDDYASALRRYLHRYREIEGERVNQEKAASGGSEGLATDHYRWHEQSSHAIIGHQHPSNSRAEEASTSLLSFDASDQRRKSGSSSRPY
ncbi:hypothetical protein EUGRSUZ_H03892 [Eucalyptus grandis]|uniref:Transcription factor CBF/NF-Y/archaeal histone domain-containing protein n=2 Tax=Eucalyptus grandis TaxID=71139 RepID=A0A059B628_EUCGR|nr:hypothetical protein EUGRSUZ_H03892 [Eucalyptus grandis]